MSVSVSKEIFALITSSVKRRRLNKRKLIVINNFPRYNASLLRKTRPCGNYVVHTVSGETNLLLTCIPISQFHTVLGFEELQRNF